MATLGLQRDSLVVDSDGVLCRGNGGRGLEGHPEHHVVAGADAALDATGPVGGGNRSGGPGHEGVIVLAARHGHSVEAGAHVEPLGCRERQHAFSQVGLKTVEYGCAEAGRYASGHTGHDAAQRVAVTPGCVDGFGHGDRGERIRATGGVGLHGVEGHRAGIHVSLHVMDPRHPAEYLNAGHLG